MTEQQIGEIARLEQLMVAKDELNHTLMQATTAYQIRMAGQEFEIYDLNKEVGDLRAGKKVLQSLQASDAQEIADQKDLVKKLTIRVVDLEGEVAEYRGY